MNSKPPPNKALRIIYAVEDGLLVAVLTAMILLSVAQIVLRNFAGVGIVWSDPFLRYMVLWVGLLGAMVATREYNHINIDIVSHFLPRRRTRSVVRVFTDSFTAVVCGFMTYAGIIFIKDEMSVATSAFGDVPAWAAELILPLAFAVIAIRYLVFAVMHIIEAAGGRSPDPSSGDESAPVVEDEANGSGGQV